MLRLVVGGVALLGAAAVGYNVGATDPNASRPTLRPDIRGFLWECDGRLLGVVAFGRHVSYTNGFVELTGADASYGAPVMTDGGGRIRLDEPAVLRHRQRFSVRFSDTTGQVLEVSLPVTAC